MPGLPCAASRRAEHDPLTFARLRPQVNRPPQLRGPAREGKKLSELSGVAGEALVNVLVMTRAAEALSLIGGSAAVVHDMTGGAIDILVLHIRRQAMGIHYEAILVSASLRVNCLSRKRFVAVVASEAVTGVRCRFFSSASVPPRPTRPLHVRSAVPRSQNGRKCRRYPHGSMRGIERQL